MKIDWDKLKVVESRDVKACKHGISEYKKSVKELRKEVRDRGLKYTGTKEELLDKINFYFDKPNLRDTIRRKGQSIVHQRHMFAQKMNYIMENMPSNEELSNAGEI